MSSGRLRALVAGGGIGGLAAGIACARTGFDVQVFERAAAFASVGAGIQLGPNATRVLHDWHLDTGLGAVASFPDRLLVRHAHSGAELGTLELGRRALQRYGAPYATVHRADLQALLQGALSTLPQVQIRFDSAIDRFSNDESQVTASFPSGSTESAELLVGADGLWSAVRDQLLADGAPVATGHLAYRALARQSALPEALRNHTQVNVWLGRRLHLVSYPVRGGDWLNLVGIVHQPRGPAATGPHGWDEATDAADLLAALTGCCASLQALVRAVPSWRLWMLYDRTPMRDACEHGTGRVVLVGDAAHPMRPYLAQGAGMAIEDAAMLETMLTGTSGADVASRLQRFAQARWQRNARVQARARRNGRIFHATGLAAQARDVSMRLFGARLLDLPWLYGHVGSRAKSTR